MMVIPLDPLPARCPVLHPGPHYGLSLFTVSQGGTHSSGRGVSTSAMCACWVAPPKYAGHKWDLGGLRIQLGICVARGMRQ